MPERQAQLLRGRRDQLGQTGHGRPAPAVTDVVQREIARDLEDPGALPDLGRGRHPRPRHAQKHLLRQVDGGVGAPDNAPEIPEDTVPVVGVEAIDVGHARDSACKNTGPAGSLAGAGKKRGTDARTP